MIHGAYIFDIDGTLADYKHRLHYLLDNEKPDFDSFYAESEKDEPIFNVVEILKLLQRTGVKIVLVTGRPMKYVNTTLNWLNKHNIPLDALYMREDGDHRQDFIVKQEMYMNQISKNFAILGVFEDRKQCVDMWRRLGLTCYQVADGNY